MRLDRFTYDWWNEPKPDADEGECEDRHRDKQEAEDDFQENTKTEQGEP